LQQFLEHNAEAHLKLKRKIKKWLRPPDTKSIPHKDLFAAKSAAIGGTCKWLLSHPDFQRWRVGEKSVLARLHGIHGCGKSTLVAYAINHLHSEGSRVAYLFCCQDAEVSAAILINCLTLQMIKHDSALLNVLKPIYEKTTGASLISLQTAAVVFKAALRAFGQCFIIVDALDECRLQDRQALVSILLESVTEIPFDLKIFCSSKNEPDLDQTILRHSRAIEIDITPDHISKDIEKMIRNNIDKTLFLYQRLQSAPPHYLGYVVDTLCNGAQGMFLLPKYMVEDLDSKGSIDEISAFLMDLPLGLHEYYLILLERMDPRWRRMAKRIFTWVVWTKRPLSLAELKEILEVDGNEYPNLAIDAKAACGCLLVIENEEIRLSHGSVKRFLVESQSFRESSIYTEFVEMYPNDHLATACTRYLFNGNYNKPARELNHFCGRRPELFSALCPFVRYAAFYWVTHCRESRNPFQFIAPILEFVSSDEMSYWCEVVGHLIALEADTFKHLCNLFQTFIVELKFRNDISPLASDHLEAIALKLSRVGAFLELWGDALSFFPGETLTFWPLVDSPNRLPGSGRQGCLMTGSRFSQAPERLHDMLEKRTVAYGFDRFLLADVNIFLWQSLMPSEPWDLAFGETLPLNPLDSTVIYLKTESILTGRLSDRFGIDPAEVGSMQATTVLRNDLRAVAIVWARYMRDKSQPLAVKSYAWLLTEGLNDPTLQRLEWSDWVDPCRVDLTVCNAFKKSKGAVAFSSEEAGEFLWTPGGKYDIRSGINTPPPPLFQDTEMSGLSFCRAATAIAGIRNQERLELYDIPRFRLIAFADGKCKVLGLSPHGKFVLFLRATKKDKEDANDSAGIVQEICLLTREKCLTVWKCERSPAQATDLEYFYSNGGLHSFSENETVLVLCVPTDPEWSLLAFDLQSSDVFGSSWEVEYSSILEGANILSFSLCPIHERRLYLLDSYGIMRTLGVARKGIMSPSISTIRTDDQPPILAAILHDPSQPRLVTATMDLSKL
jgi:hypothetical protein